jgi:hypothetical protein
MRLSERDLLKFNQNNPDPAMKCHRCEGHMVHQKFYGPHEHFWGWRCISCGEIVDQIILENRGSMATGQLRG